MKGGCNYYAIICPQVIGRLVVGAPEGFNVVKRWFKAFSYESSVLVQGTNDYYV